MREIKELTLLELREALWVAAKAYPMMGLNSTAKLDEFEARIKADFDQPTRRWYGLFEDGKLLGSMVLYDFIQNYFGTELRAMGIGFVAVDFLHKKQKVAKDLLSWYLLSALKQKFPLAILYSFRPDFYQKMGFGFGTACYNYQIDPHCLPQMTEQAQMDYLSPEDKDEVIAFYQALYYQQHGMIKKKDKDVEAMLKAPGVYIAGYREKGILTSLVIFRLISDDSTNQSTHMKLDLLFTNSCGLKAALNFLHSQADQVSEIAFSTPYRDFFYNLADIRHLDHRILKDPGFHHVYDAGMGMMYRSLNPVELLINRPCNLDDLLIRFRITDTFIPDTLQDFVIGWKAGIAKLSHGKKYDLELSFEVADFSSWIVNATDLLTLHQFGLVQISDEAFLQMLDQAFYYQQKPVCIERF
jgi:predicted acetyltransferase